MFIPINVLVYAILTVIFIIWIVYDVVIDRPGHVESFFDDSSPSGKLSQLGKATIGLYLACTLLWAQLNNWF